MELDNFFVIKNTLNKTLIVSHIPTTNEYVDVLTSYQGSLSLEFDLETNSGSTTNLLQDIIPKFEEDVLEQMCCRP
jgi:hypothetical protein